jgi:hypothetical protein
LQGNEGCSYKLRIDWPADNVLLDDNERSCSCDEYLAGVKSSLVIDRWTIDKKRQKRPGRM